MDMSRLEITDYQTVWYYVVSLTAKDAVEITSVDVAHILPLNG